MRTKVIGSGTLENVYVLVTDDICPVPPSAPLTMKSLLAQMVLDAGKDIVSPRTGGGLNTAAWYLSLTGHVPTGPLVQTTELTPVVPPPVADPLKVRLSPVNIKLFNPVSIKVKNRSWKLPTPVADIPIFHCMPSCPGMVLFSVSVMLDAGIAAPVGLAVETRLKFDNWMSPMVQVPTAWNVAQLALWAQVAAFVEADDMRAAMVNSKEKVIFCRVFMRPSFLQVTFQDFFKKSLERSVVQTII